MPSLGQIREALAKTLLREISEVPLNVYYNVSDLGQLPAVVIEPVSADFEEVFAELGEDVWDFNLFVLVNRNLDSESGQDTLDGFVTGWGPSSIRHVLWSNSDLGFDEDLNVDAQVYMLKGYGGSFEWSKIPHVGAVLKVRVRFDGR